tara:strand:- start:527 stop:814 length:288 start_codon:yes stop_codon:yes gene_type:complete
MAMNRFTNKYHRDIPHKPKKDKTMNDKTIEGIQSELKMFYQRHEEVVKTLGHINTEIRLLEDELKELVKSVNAHHRLIQPQTWQICSASTRRNDT